MSERTCWTRRDILQRGAAASAVLTAGGAMLGAAGCANPSGDVDGESRRASFAPSANRLLVVDAQVHLWSSGSPGQPHRQRSSFTARDALDEMAAGGVDAALVHPPISWDPSANELAIEAARLHPQRFAVMANAELDQPDAIGRLDWLRRQTGVLGLRFAFLRPHQKRWLQDGSIDWLWATAERWQLPVALAASDGLLQAIGPIAERHPRLKLMIDHFGRPDLQWSNLPDLVAAAKHPNVAVKATGAASYSTQPYPHRDIHDHLQRVFDAYGPGRMFWGTDITRMKDDWSQCVRLFTEELPWLTGVDRQLVMGGALCNWIGWKL